MVTAAMKLKGSCSLEGKLWLTDCIKRQRYHFANKVCQRCGFSSSHVGAWELDHKEDWAPKNWYLCAGEQSLGQQGDQISQSERESVLNIHWKDWGWGWSANTLAT